MKFLADENIEQPLIEALRAAGYDVAALTEDQRGLPDDQVLSRAETEGRILLANDKDFGELILRLHRLGTGIVLLRLGTEDGAEKAAQVIKILPAIQARLTGQFAVVTEEQMRLRPLQLPGKEPDE